MLVTNVKHSSRPRHANALMGLKIQSNDVCLIVCEYSASKIVDVVWHGVQFA